MRRLRKLAVLGIVGLSFLMPGTAQAYFGVGLGAVDEDHFGYGILFGGGLPWDLGFDIQVMAFVDKGTPDLYWVQPNADITYDFNKFWKKVSETVELHPYVKAGFTYGLAVIDTANVDSQVTHGPGFNFGGGVDWKLMDLLTVGFDITQSFIFLEAVTVQGFQIGQDTTAKVFNAIVTLKFFAY